MAILFVILFIVVGCIVYVTRNDVGVSLKGAAGERKVSQQILQLPEEYIILDDIKLRTKNGTSQIDHVVVSKYAIFAIIPSRYLRHREN